MPGPYKKFTAQEKASADGAMKAAKASIDAAGAKVNVVQQNGTCQVNDHIVDDLHLAKASIEFALNDLGGRPCGGGRPC